MEVAGLFSTVTTPTLNQGETESKTVYEEVCTTFPLDLVGQFFFTFFGSGPHYAACGILVPLPGIELMPPAVEAQSLNHWATREVQ